MSQVASMRWMLSLFGFFLGLLLAFFLFVFLPARKLPTLIPRCLFCTAPASFAYRLPSADPGPALREKPERSYVSMHDRKTTSDRYPSIFTQPEGAVPWFRPSQRITDFSIANLHANYIQEYEIDSFGRRATAGAGSRHLLVLGCSYVFGSGVEATETLPAQLRLKNFQSYNLGNPGDGPGSILLRTLDERYFAGIRQKKGIALYYLMNDHVQRALGSYHLSRSWGRRLPRFELVDGKPKHVGQMGNLGLPEPLFAGFEYLEYIGITWPLYYSDRDLELVAAELAGVRENYLRQFPGGRFVVVIAPRLRAQPVTYDLRAFLEKRQLEYLDYGELEMHDYVAAPFIPGDGHPSAAYYAKVSAWLVGDLTQSVLDAEDRAR